MARHIKKPKVIKEQELKEDAGPIEIELSEKEPVDLQALHALKAEQKYQAVVKAIQEAAAPSSQQDSSRPRTVSFNAWFQKVCTKNQKIKLSYKEAIESHCRSIGISQSATEEEFDAALAHFGL